jgi:hypothetical protein
LSGRVNTSFDGFLKAFGGKCRLIAGAEREAGFSVNATENAKMTSMRSFG